MTLDVSKDLEEMLRDAEPSGAEAVGPSRPDPGPGASDGGPGNGGGEGGGHTRMARWAEKYDIRNSWQVIAGAILIPLGVVFILLGWYGAAHARVVQQQIPYMVSGSFVGLGCMIVGGLLFWGHWLYRIYDQADLHHEEQQRVLETIAAALQARGVDGSGAAVGGAASAGGGVVGAAPSSSGGMVAGGVEGGGASGTFYATATGTVFHRADCPVIAHHPADLRVLGRGGVAGMRPCQICSPN
jgi:hypothetical protein